MAKQSNKEKEKHLAELREELKEAQRTFTEERKKYAAAIKELGLSEKERTRGQAILEEQGDDTPAGELQGSYSAEDRNIYARFMEYLSLKIGISAFSVRVFSLESSIFIAEHEEEIFRWKRENKVREDRDYLSVGDYIEYTEYLETLSPEKLYRSALGLELNKFPDGKRR